MKKITPMLISLFLLFTVVGANGEISENSSSTNRDWTIVEIFPIPEGASGLAYDGTYLYCGIYGANGNEVYQIDPSDGSYSLLFTGPQGDAFGLTYDGTYLWTTDHPGSSSTPAVAMQLDWNGNLISQFDLPTHYMSGIAYDDSDFWVAAYYPDPATIYKVNSSGTILQQFTAPDNQPWDLCIEHDNLWMADYWGDALYMIDPDTGTLLETHPSEHSDPAGIVFDGAYLWYCDNGEGGQDWLYKIDLGGAGTPEIYIPITSHNFGIVTIGDFATWDAVAQNIGTADLVIDTVSFTGDNICVTCPLEFPITITPGNQEEIPFIYTPVNPEPLNIIATIESNDPLHPEVDITLTGYAVNPGPSIYLPELSHNYGLVRVNAWTRWFAEIQNIGDEELVIDSIYCDNPHFWPDSDVSFPVNIGVLDTVRIGIWFSPEQAILYEGTLFIESNDPENSVVEVTLEGTGDDTHYELGDILWEYQITGGFDNSPKAILAIPDVNGDEIYDVVVCSEDNYIRCFNGNSSDTPDILWELSITGGSVYQQSSITLTDDIDGDGYKDIVVGTAWGDRSIVAISGKTGEIIWKHDTHEYGEGGWVYQVSCRYDYNDDGMLDVLAAAGSDANYAGPRRVYCLDAFTGDSIWECFLGGPVFSVIGVADFTGDGVPDVVAGAADNYETQGTVYGIDGATGNTIWNFDVDGTSVWALEQLQDITGYGIPDVIAGNFQAFGTGICYGLDATDGSQVWTTTLGTALILRFAVLDDINNNGYREIAVAHSSNPNVFVIDGGDGNTVWTHGVADQPWNLDRIEDINDDGIADLVVGTLFNSNYCYFLSGADGTELSSINFGTPVDAIASIPDIDGNNSMEMVAGGRNGRLTCFSGGWEVFGIAAPEPNDNQYFLQNYPNPFSTSTTISFNIHSSSLRPENAEIRIYNIKGQLVRELGFSPPAGGSDLGFGEAVWDGRDGAGTPVSNGIYFYQLEADDYKSEIRKMILVR
jgi:outer membrane protein assembly factor BamB